MKKIIAVSAPVFLVALLACGSAGEVDASGAGGAAASSSSSGAPDAGVSDAPEADAPDCATCNDVLTGPDPVGSAHALCIGPDAWLRDFLQCGCGVPGLCLGDCSGPGSWCEGAWPTVTAWVEPAGACKMCLEQVDAMGCGVERGICLLH